MLSGNRSAPHLGNEVHSALALLLLQLQRDAADRPTLDALHEMGDEASNLVAHPLGRDDGNLIAHSFVGVEVKSQARVVLLNDSPGGLLDSLSSDTLFH